MKLENKFIYIALIFGIIFSIIVPPFNSPDEDSHFLKSYVISKGQFFSESNSKSTGYYVPKNMLNYINMSKSHIGNRDWKYNYSSFYLDMLLKSDLDSVEFVSFSTSDTTPIAHIIPAFGIVIGKLVSPLFFEKGYSVTYLLQFARFFSLVAYICICFFAIKNTPIYKRSLFCISLMPMCMFLASCISYDMLLIGLSLLFVSKALQLILDNQKKKVEYKDIVLLTLCLYVFSSLKIVYFLLAFLLFFIPKKKFCGKKDIIRKVLTAVLIFSGLLLIIKIFTPIAACCSSSHSNSSAQIDFILSNPFVYFKILFSNILSQKSWLINTTFGCFGLIDTYLPPIYVFGMMIFYLLLFVTDNFQKKIKVNKWIRILSFLSTVLIIVIIYTAMYVFWTPKVLNVIGGNAISGIQGRYFLPIFCLVPIMLPKMTSLNKLINNNVEASFDNCAIIGSIIILIISILIVILRFWV